MRRHLLTLILASAVCGSVAYSTESVAAPQDAPDGRTISWGLCDPARNDIADDVECGTMSLPVDWNDPDGATFTARVYRQRADGERRGTIIDFPSGPGATADIGFSTLKPLAPGYDLIGIDPRGVASTAPVTCSYDAVLAAPLAPPADRAAFERTRGLRDTVYQSCSTSPKSLIDHLDAYSNANDAEAFRRALGAPRVVVSGTSYGTLLGARYLERFGDQARGAVLDSVLAPGRTAEQFQSEAARGNQRLFDEFAGWCATDPQCPIRAEGASAAMAAAKRNADRGLIPGKTALGRDWDAAGVVQAFELSAGVDDFSGAASALRALVDHRNPVTDAPTATPTGIRDVYPDAIVCADLDLGIRDWSTARSILHAAARGNPDTPYSTNALAYATACAGAPRPEPSAANGFRSGGDFPILLLSNRFDVATPIAWAEEVKTVLGDRARHLVRDGVGHGDVTTDPAIARQVREYLASRRR
ncbi:alpha/beta fold hydrolase [Gordonia sp. (in: high G+C Gram-positive bacteria)]|uniref:alpha/beta fold hydrolase n=1 Tax=Gordonia sp. (in: high G+C Gram-positive bacteria) TaxID=84139 RepID=UPI003F9EA141